MSKQTSGRDARVGILPDTPRERNVKMFDGFMKSPLWANLYRQELAKESGKPIIQMLMDENYREPPDAKLKPVVVPGQVSAVFLFCSLQSEFFFAGVRPEAWCHHCQEHC